MKISKILIGIDDSKYAEYAAAYGFDLAKAFNAQVGLVHVMEPAVTPSTEPDSLTGLPFEPATLINEAEILDIQENLADNVANRTAEKYGHGLQISFFNEFGSTADGILKCSAEFGADMVVMGTHSRTGIDRLLLGNVAETVVRTSAVPVLVVPLNEAE